MPRTVGGMSWTSAYRARGADLPFGDPGAAHGVPFEGYYWRIVASRERSGAWSR